MPVETKRRSDRRGVLAGTAPAEACRRDPRSDEPGVVTSTGFFEESTLNLDYFLLEIAAAFLGCVVAVGLWAPFAAHWLQRTRRDSKVSCNPQSPPGGYDC